MIPFVGRIHHVYEIKFPFVSRVSRQTAAHSVSGQFKYPRRYQGFSMVFQSHFTVLAASLAGLCATGLITSTVGASTISLTNPGFESGALTPLKSGLAVGVYTPESVTWTVAPGNAAIGQALIVGAADGVGSTGTGGDVYFDNAA